MHTHRKKVLHETVTLFSVVMPCHNEQEHIYDNLLLTASVLGEADYEIIAVNDGSTDLTLEQILRASKDCPRIRVISHLKNRGKGYAVMEGFKASMGECIVLFDSDLEIHPRYIREFLELYEKAGADVVVASAKLPGSVVKSSGPRRMLSRIYYFFVRLFIVPIGHEAGLHVYRRDVLERVFPQLTTTRYAAEIEQLALCYRMGCRIVEAPVEIRFRDRGGMGLFDWLHCGLETALMWFRLQISKSFYSLGKGKG